VVNLGAEVWSLLSLQLSSLPRLVSPPQLFVASVGESNSTCVLMKSLAMTSNNIPNFFNRRAEAALFAQGGDLEAGLLMVGLCCLLLGNACASRGVLFMNVLGAYAAI